jgi:hypothetical protein
MNTTDILKDTNQMQDQSNILNQLKDSVTSLASINYAKKM